MRGRFVATVTDRAADRTDRTDRAADRTDHHVTGDPTESG
jgi:hypothetical protein